MAAAGQAFGLGPVLYLENKYKTRLVNLRTSEPFSQGLRGALWSFKPGAFGSSGGVKRRGPTAGVTKYLDPEIN